MDMDGLSAQEVTAGMRAQPPIKPRGFALSIIVILVIVLFLDTIAIGLRVYSKAWLLRKHKVWGLDDTLAVLGFVPWIPATTYIVLGVFNGIGTKDSELPPLASGGYFLQLKAAEYLTKWQLTVVVTIPFVKNAIAVQIMRLTFQRRYRYLLWFAIFTSTINAIGGLISVLVHCKPIAATWNPKLGECGSLEPLMKLSYAFTAVAIMSDCICAIIPFFFISKMNMKVRKKWGVIGVLSIGICACIFTIARVPYLKYYLIPEDQLYHYGYMCLFTMLEEGVGMIAGCMPSIYKLYSTFYGSLSDSRTTGRVEAAATIGGTPMDSLTPISKGHIRKA
ncbi:hypothetical protein Daus18300_007880 [Diaporthe australafricana]|uniref:Rhodopsin domain-containing protein n=1 Tax=Diaporthe australafricana TaxID=127596 RepID=A0ABR3WKC2_9PEZI